MKCPKCNGLMYTESILEFDGVSHIWKCINCGAVIDPIILQNRMLFNGPHRIKVAIGPKEPEKECLPRLKRVAMRAVKASARYASSN